MLVAQRLGFDRTFLWSEKQQNNIVAVQPQIIERLLEKFIAVHGDKPKEASPLIVVYEFFALWHEWITRYSTKKKKGKEEGLLQAYRHGRRKDERKFVKLFARFCHLARKVAPLVIGGIHFGASEERLPNSTSQDEHDEIFEGISLVFGARSPITQCYADARRIFYEDVHLASRPYLLAHLLRDMTEALIGHFINLRKAKTLQSDFIRQSLAKVIRILDLGDRIDVAEWVDLYKRCVQCTHLDVTQDALARSDEMDSTWQAFNALLRRAFGGEDNVQRLLTAILCYCGSSYNNNGHNTTDSHFNAGTGFSPSQLHVFRTLLDLALLKDRRFCHVISQNLVVSEQVWLHVIVKKCDPALLTNPPIIAEAQDEGNEEIHFQSQLLLYLAKLLRVKAEEARTLHRMRAGLLEAMEGWRRRTALTLATTLTATPLDNDATHDATLHTALDTPTLTLDATTATAATTTTVDNDATRSSTPTLEEQKIARAWDADLLHDIIAGLIRFINSTIRGKDTRALKLAVIEEIAMSFGGVVTLKRLEELVAREYNNHNNHNTNNNHNNNKVDPRALERFLVASNVIDEYGVVRYHPLRQHNKHNTTTNNSNNNRLSTIKKKFKVDEGPIERLLLDVLENSPIGRESVLEKLIGRLNFIDIFSASPSMVLPLEGLVDTWMTEGGIGAAIAAYLPPPLCESLRVRLCEVVVESVVQVRKLAGGDKEKEKEKEKGEGAAWLAVNSTYQALVVQSEALKNKYEEVVRQVVLQEEWSPLIDALAVLEDALHAMQVLVYRLSFFYSWPPHYFNG